MSLGRLLASGRSVVDVKGAVDSPRRNKYINLPKFISPRNPFLRGGADAKAAAGQAEAPVIEDVSPELKPAASPAANAIARRVVKEQPIVIRTRFVLMRLCVARWLSRFWDRMAGWASRLNPARLLKRSPKTVEAVTRCAKPAVQEELSLESVRVVRNDLHDGEGEVVDARPAARRSMPVSVVTEKAELVGKAVDRLTTRIFGAD